MKKFVFEHSSESLCDLRLHQFEDVIELRAVHDADYLRKAELYFGAIVGGENLAIV